MRKTVLGYKLEMNICTFWKILHVVCFPTVENTFLAVNMKAHWEPWLQTSQTRNIVHCSVAASILCTQSSLLPLPSVSFSHRHYRHGLTVFFSQLCPFVLIHDSITNFKWSLVLSLSWWTFHIFYICLLHVCAFMHEAWRRCAGLLCGQAWGQCHHLNCPCGLSEVCANFLPKWKD